MSANTGTLQGRFRGLPDRDEHSSRALVVVPADDKESARLIVSQIVLDGLRDLKMSYPKVTPKRRLELASIRKKLAKEA